MFLTIKTRFWFLFPVKAGREEVSFWTAFLVDWLILAWLTSKEISHQPSNPDPANVQELWLGSVSKPWVCPPSFLSGLCPTGHPHTALVKQCGESWTWLSLSHRVVSNTEGESYEPKASWSLTHGGRLSLLCTLVCRPSLSTRSPWWREGSKEQQLLALPPDSRADVFLRARQASCWTHRSGTHGDSRFIIPYH